MEKLETYIGKLAIEKGYLTQQKLDECIAILDQEDSSDRIEDALIKKGYLTPEQIKQLEARQKINLKKIEAEAIVEYIRKMKIVTEEQLTRCLDVQEKAREQKKYIPLDMILVSHGMITQEQSNEFLLAPEVQRKVKEALWNDDPRRTGLVGRVLGGYEILSKIAAGGMGVVFRAKQLELNRVVALKILFEKFASQDKHLNQFFREARLSAILNHPNLVHIFDMGHHQGFFYYAMELVEGTNLGDYLKEKTKLSQAECLDLITQAGSGLEHIHSFDIVHRDIKPSNFIVRADGIVKIMDLGLAQQLGQSSKKVATMGTPYYMAPELINNPKEANHRADIYALGVSFYRMLTGEYPITGSDAKEILKNIAEQIPKPLHSIIPEINPEIEKVVNKMIEKDLSKRYQSMTDVLNDMDRILLVENV